MTSEDHTRLSDMRMHFVVPASEEEIFGYFDAAAASAQSVYQPAAKAFRHSILSALSTVAMPFHLANASVTQSHYRRFHSAESIRMLKTTVPPSGEDLETFRAREAGRKADLRMTEFFQSEDGRGLIIHDISIFLLSSLQKNGIKSAARELILQGLVLLWSAFEVLFRDTFETLLNQDPDRIKLLVNHPTTRKRFDAERLPLDVLVRHGYDLSARLGSALICQQDISDLPTVKAVYSVLFPGEAELRDAMAQGRLWTLYQCRHLVVHRRGIIDQAFLDATGEGHALDTQLVVTPQELEDLLAVVVSCGSALVRSLVA